MKHFKSRIFVEVPCGACNEPLLLSAESIVEGWRLAAEGCSGAASYECPVQQFVPFGPPQIDTLETVLDVLEEDEAPKKRRPDPDCGF